MKTDTGRQQPYVEKDFNKNKKQQETNLPKDSTKNKNPHPTANENIKDQGKKKQADPSRRPGWEISDGVDG